MLQDVSHELRSPLARLSCAAELMKDIIRSRGSHTPDAAGDRRIIAVGCDAHGGNLSAEGDPASRKVQRVAISELVREIVADCGLEAEARHVGIDSEVHSSAAVEGDPELLRRAVENVLRNAIRFAPADSRVSVKVEEKGGNGNVAVQVRIYYGCLGAPARAACAHF